VTLSYAGYLPAQEAHVKSALDTAIDLFSEKATNEARLRAGEEID